MLVLVQTTIALVAVLMGKVRARSSAQFEKSVRARSAAHVLVRNWMKSRLRVTARATLNMSGTENG